jgi:hypothetical protein
VQLPLYHHGPRGKIGYGHKAIGIGCFAGQQGKHPGIDTEIQRILLHIPHKTLLSKCARRQFLQKRLRHNAF